MKEPGILAELESIVQQLNIELRTEKGDFTGGLCRVADQKILILNKAATPGQNIDLIARELATQDLADIFIIPAIRKLIDERREKSKVEA